MGPGAARAATGRRKVTMVEKCILAFLVAMLLLGGKIRFECEVDFGKMIFHHERGDD